MNNIYWPRVLITGGTGSFGNAMTQHLLSSSTSTVCIYSRDEVKQAEMREKYDDSRLRFFLGDVRDRERLSTAMLGVDVVFHAAALKRVESCSYNPQEAIATNVAGTMNVCHAAIEAGVSLVLALSSDKACAATTLYGSTKATAEHIVSASNALSRGRTKLSSLRYGNVAGSRGSVIPLWRAAIAAGDPVPMVNPDATRFWFTLDGAVSFAMWALENMAGGELFVPRLPSFRVGDLATAMGACAFKPMDARPGEKHHESMVSLDEAPHFRSRGDKYVRYLPGSERGLLLPEGFSYRSDCNEDRMSVERLREAIA